MKHSNPITYRAGTWLFLRGLGVVYLIAFGSLWVQIEGLIGSNGILPVADYLAWFQANADGLWRLPTLLHLHHGDAALHALCAAGVALSLAVVAGRATLPALAALWILYLSLVLGGQAFLAFQWDVLLLETGFCALFVAAWGWRSPAPTGPRTPPRAGLWLLWLLAFKLMFLSGIVKPLSMDATWWSRTALDFHYWTQPLPTWTSWYADRLPDGFQRTSVWVTYAIEIVLPFGVFAGRWGRRAFAAGTVILMTLIAWTGNYGFFNLLTIVLCLPLLDDEPFRRFATFAKPADPGIARRLLWIPVALLLGLSLLVSLREAARTVPPGTGGRAARFQTWVGERVLPWSEPTVLRWSEPFRTVNGYGLFRSMTRTRPEIVLEGSDDGVEWRPYAFRWKPGDPGRRPRFVAPHMPRLDWQMWFAALGPQRAQYWLEGLMRAVLRGSPEVLALLEGNPFPDAPPRYVRLQYYQYRFAAAEERAASGAWWSRTLEGSLTPPLSAERLEPRR